MRKHIKILAIAALAFVRCGHRPPTETISFRPLVPQVISQPETVHIRPLPYWLE